MSAKGQYYPRGANMYVPLMNYAADLSLEFPYIDLVTPFSAASVTTILANQSINTAGSTQAFNGGWNSPLADMGRFGRCLAIQSGAGAGSVVIVRGFDYLGQPMAEQLTVVNGTVSGLKAFRWITSIAWTAVGGATINVGFRDCFGLPYANIGGAPQQDYMSVAGAISQPTAGTFVTKTDVQSLTSGDPRGTYAPNGANPANGARIFQVVYQPLRGNLYGPRHFFA